MKFRLYYESLLSKIGSYQKPDPGMILDSPHGNRGRAPRKWRWQSSQCLSLPSWNVEPVTLAILDSWIQGEDLILGSRSLDT
jgi:hypothetical protein